MISISHQQNSDLVSRVVREVLANDYAGYKPGAKRKICQSTTA